MKTYIGTKIIQAEPAFRIDGEIYPESGPVPRSMNREEGYRVHYPDGYESWSPKDVFEQAYLPLTVNPDLRTDAPSISQQMVDDFILETWTQTMGDKTTVVRALLRNGFEIVESSACVSAENYDEKLGREICLGKIKDKVWFLLGFLLADRGTWREEGENGGRQAGLRHDLGMAIEAAKKGKRIARKGWKRKRPVCGAGKGHQLQKPHRRGGECGARRHWEPGAGLRGHLRRADGLAGLPGRYAGGRLGDCGGLIWSILRGRR